MQYTLINHFSEVASAIIILMLAIGEANEIAGFLREDLPHVEALY